MFGNTQPTGFGGGGAGGFGGFGGGGATGGGFGGGGLGNQPAATGFGGMGNANAGGFGGFGTGAQPAATGFGGAGGNNGFGLGGAGGANPGFGGGAAGGGFGAPGLSLGGNAGGGGMFGGAGGTNTGFGGGLGGGNTGFGMGNGMGNVVGTSNIPFQRQVERENANGKEKIDTLMNLVCMPQYKARMIDELRFEDYRAGFKAGQSRPGMGIGGAAAPLGGLGGGLGGNTLGGAAPLGGLGGGLGGNTGGGGLFGGAGGNTGALGGGGGLFGNTGAGGGGGGLFGGAGGNTGGLGGNLGGGGGLFGGAGGNTGGLGGGNLLGGGNTGGGGLFGGAGGNTGGLGGLGGNLGGGGLFSGAGGNTGALGGGGGLFGNTGAGGGGGGLFGGAGGNTGGLGGNLGGGGGLFGGGGNTGGLGGNMPSLNLGGGGGGGLFGGGGNTGGLGGNMGGGGGGLFGGGNNANRSPLGATGGLNLGNTMLGGGGGSSLFPNMGGMGGGAGGSLFGGPTNTMLNNPAASNLSNASSLPNLGRAISSETVPYASGSESLMVHQTSLAKSDWIVDNPEPSKKSDLIKASPKYYNEFEAVRRPAITPRGYGRVSKTPLVTNSSLASKSKIFGSIATPNTAQKKKLLIDRSRREEVSDRDREVEQEEKEEGTNQKELHYPETNENENTKLAEHEGTEITTPLKPGYNSREPIQISDSDSNNEEPNDNISSLAAENHNQYPVMSKEYENKFYKVYPSIEELRSKSIEELRSLPNFSVERGGFGKIEWIGAVDVTELNIDEVIQIEVREVIVYPDHIKNYPNVGNKLNRPARITLEAISPDEELSEEEAIELFKDSIENPEGDSPPAKFIKYTLSTEELVFEVEHFTKYTIIGSAKKKRKTQDDIISAPGNNNDNNSGQPSAMETEKPSTQATLIASKVSGIHTQQRVISNNNNINIATDKQLHHLQQQQSRGTDHGDVNGKSSNGKYDDIESKRQSILKPAFNLESKATSFVNDLYKRVSSESNTKDTTNRFNPYFVRRPFRPSWGPNGELVCLDVKKSSDVAKVVIVKVQGADVSENASNKAPSVVKAAVLENMLQGHLKAARSGDWQSMIKGFGASAAYSSKVIGSAYGFDSNVLTHSLNLWKLFYSLWSDGRSDANIAIANNKELSFRTPRSQTAFNRQTGLINKRSVHVVNKLFRSLSNPNPQSISSQQPGNDNLSIVVQLLIDNKFEEAVMQAIKMGDFRLATLIPQSVAGDAASQKNISLQLQAWDKQAFRNETKSITRLYKILSGDVQEEQSNENNWIRAFSLQLHFAEEPTSPLIAALESYNIKYKTKAAPAPAPWYDKFNSFDSKYHQPDSIYDNIYSILAFACNQKPEDLARALDPRSYSPDVLDWSISWQTMQALIGINANQKFFRVNQILEDKIRMNFASQLESLGLWEWAIYVYLVNSTLLARRSSVESILARHVHFSNEIEKKRLYTKLDWLHKNLGIPHDWLERGQAYRGNYSHFNIDEKVKSAVLSRSWDYFNELMANKIGPSAIMYGNKGDAAGFRDILHLSITRGWKYDANDINCQHIELYDAYILAKLENKNTSESVERIYECLTDNRYKEHLRTCYASLKNEKISATRLVAHEEIKKKMFVIQEIVAWLLINVSESKDITNAGINLNDLPVRQDKSVEILGHLSHITTASR